MKISKEALSKVIDISKAIAIIGIFLFHFFDDFFTLNIPDSVLMKIVELGSKVGSQGVLFFFFASGFGLTLSHLKQKSKKGFLVRRVKKIVPSYYFSIALLLIVFIWFIPKGTSWGIWTVLSDVFFLRNFFIETIKGVNPNWWFVATMIQFYIIFFFIRRKVETIDAGKVIALGLSIDIVYKLFVLYLGVAHDFNIDSNGLTPFTTLSLNYAFPFSLGICLAKKVFDKKEIEFKNIPLILVLAIIFEGIGAYLSSSIVGRLFNDLFFSMGYLVLIFAISYFVFRSGDLISSIFLVITGISFEIYLLHHPIIRIVSQNFDMGPFMNLLTSIIIVALGSILIKNISSFIQVKTAKEKS